jgi:hypothetical protein
VLRICQITPSASIDTHNAPRVLQIPAGLHRRQRFGTNDFQRIAAENGVAVLFTGHPHRRCEMEMHGEFFGDDLRLMDTLRPRPAMIELLQRDDVGFALADGVHDPRRGPNAVGAHTTVDVVAHDPHVSIYASRDGFARPLIDDRVSASVLAVGGTCSPIYLPHIFRMHGPSKYGNRQPAGTCRRCACAGCPSRGAARRGARSGTSRRRPGRGSGGRNCR